MQGVGILALPELAGLAAGSLREVPGCASWAAALGRLAIELRPDWAPWPLLVCAVGLSVGLRLWRAWEGSIESPAGEIRSGFEAALLAGASRSRARAAGRPRRLTLWIGRFVLAASLAATNLTPALLFTPWSDGQTVAPAILALVDGPDDARFQAAALALLAIAGLLIALPVARLTSAWPRDCWVERC
jgi:hypothetical protein